MKRRLLVLIVVLITTICLFFSNAFAAPELVESGTTTSGDSETRQIGSAESVDAQGGNVTSMNITQVTQTQFWQGFWGQVDSELRLEDASGNLFYNWSVTSVSSGEVFFTNTSAITWGTNIRNATDAEVLTSQLDYNWANSTGADNLTQTYQRSNGHQEFNISFSSGGNLQINETSTPSVSLEGGIFNCTMLWETGSGSPFWASIINPDKASFNSELADFEALLPVRGPLGGEVYYAYVELE